jgi:hypothetical protein
MLKYRNAELALGALFGAALLAGVWGWHNSYTLTEKQKDECYEGAKKTGQKSDECKTFWERTTSDPIALFTLVLAVSTVGLWVATIFLYRAGEKQIAIAGQSADAAREAAEAAKIFAGEIIAERRPFVGVPKDGIKIIEPLTFDEKQATITFGLILKNVGKSVAMNVTQQTSGLQISPIIPEGLPFHPAEMSQRLQSFTNCRESMTKTFKDLGTMLLPGGDEVVEFRAEALRNNFKVRGNGNVSAWITICIAYKDDAGKLHGTGMILEFRTKARLDQFKPIGVVPGELKMFAMGASNF